MEDDMHAPVMEPDDSDGRQPASATGDRRTPRPILVADDDDDMRVLIATVLRRAGYRVVEARDGMEALDRVATSVSDTSRDLIGVIVSDMNMPGLGGLDVLAALRCARCDTPLILITAFGDRDSRAEAGELGVFAYLEKPLDVSALRRAVEQATA
jgi:CheY-like chemotaxis protein